ncbi:MAG: DUF3810 domain-containing protein [Tepidanaerobacteraceae bacterium]|nr:DUF3810 domain-containing protein [Tepidanaerobacteraceae bacterium]
MLLLIGILIFLVSGYYPQITENIYSTFIYKILGQSISKITGIFPFSIAEVIILFSVISITAYTLRSAFYFIKTKKIRELKKLFLNILTAAGIIYFSFQLLWGLNYNRVRLDEILSLDARAPTQEELIGLCEDLIVRTNKLRVDLNQNANNVMELPYEKAQALRIAYKGFENASLYYPRLDGKYGQPKGIILSEPMCYTGISGFFFPFTGEANVNMATPDPFFPCTITHEMAHQRGFAREDEANFIAYIACINHPDIYFQYSGTLSALSYSMRALKKVSDSKYNELLTAYSEGVARDIKFNNDFWSQYSGPIEKASNKINDTYLKTQNQKTGVKSYGAMVDLLIAEYRRKNKG